MSHKVSGWIKNFAWNNFHKRTSCFANLHFSVVKEKNSFLGNIFYLLTRELMPVWCIKKQ